MEKQKPHLQCTCNGCYERFHTHEQYLSHLRKDHGAALLASDVEDDGGYPFTRCDPFGEDYG